MPPTRIYRAVYEGAKMVSAGQDVSLQLTKPVKELVEWNFPLSQTLEKYCSSFNAKCNKNFGEAGLVLQNSTAVYVHRLDNLWNKIGYFKNILPNVENEEAPKNSSKKKNKKTDMCFQDFKTVDFAQEVEKNIDLKKNQITHDILKSKSRRFTQLEKNVAQHIPIDICDVNGEVIGKKYDFRCNQNVSMDGILVDEFAPQDFYCDGENSIIENSISSNLNYSKQTKSLESSCSKVIDTVMQDIENNETASSDAESARNDDNWQTEENSFLASTSESSQQNLCSSTNINTDNTIHITNITNDNCHEMILTSSSNETRIDTPCDTSSPMITGINNTVSSNNNNTDAIYFNDNDRQSIGISSVLDSPPESVNSKERTLSTDDPMLLNNTTEILLSAKLNANFVQSISPKHNVTEKTRVRSIPRTLSKPLNLKLLKPCKRKLSITKKNIKYTFEELNSSRRGRPNMFKKSSTACLKYIREYDSCKYEAVTNETLDFLGFRLRVNEPEKSVDDITNINDNVMPTLSDDENSEMEFAQSSRSIDMSPLQENLCDTSFRTDSPHFMLGNVDKWHEYIQPKLREAEQRSTFCIGDYTSQVMSTLKSKEKVYFDTIVQNEHPCEVARYFLASLDLASKYKIDINTNTDHEHIELVLHKGNRQSFC